MREFSNPEFAEGWFEEEVRTLIEDTTNDTLEIISHAHNEFAYESVYFEKIVMRFTPDAIQIVDIEAKRTGDGAGSQFISALKTAAEHRGVRIEALNVRPTAASWWEQQGFTPDQYASDYIWEPSV